MSENTQNTPSVRLSERLTPLVREAVALKGDGKEAARAFRDRLFEFRKDLDQNEKRTVGDLLMQYAVKGRLPMQAFSLMSPRFQEPIRARAFRLVIAFTSLEGGHFSPKDAGHLVEAARKSGDLTEEVRKAINTLDAYANSRGIFARDYQDKKNARKGIEAALEAALGGLDAPVEEPDPDIESVIATLESQLATAKTAKVAAAAGDDDDALTAATAEVKRVSAELTEARQQMTATTAQIVAEVLVQSETPPTPTTYVGKLKAKGESRPAFMDIARKADGGDPLATVAAEQILKLN